MPSSFASSYEISTETPLALWPVGFASNALPKLITHRSGDVNRVLVVMLLVFWVWEALQVILPLVFFLMTRA